MLFRSRCPTAGPGSPTASKKSFPKSRYRCGLYFAELENCFLISPNSFFLIAIVYALFVFLLKNKSMDTILMYVSMLKIIRMVNPRQVQHSFVGLAQMDLERLV